MPKFYRENEEWFGTDCVVEKGKIFALPENSLLGGSGKLGGRRLLFDYEQLIGKWAFKFKSNLNLKISFQLKAKIELATKSK